MKTVVCSLRDEGLINTKYAALSNSQPIVRTGRGGGGGQVPCVVLKAREQYH